MSNQEPVQEFQTPPPLTTERAILGFFFVIPCGAGVAFVLLAVLSSVGEVAPHQAMYQSAFSVLGGILLIYGPFWKVLRRDWPLVAGFIAGMIATSAVWWSEYLT